MTFRPLLQQVSSIGPVLPLAIGTLAAGVLLLPHSTLHAEVPPEEHVDKFPRPRW